MLGTLAVSLSVMRTRILPARKRALLDLPAFKEAPFVLFTLGMFFGFMGMYIPFFYVQSYAIEEKVSFPFPFARFFFFFPALGVEER